MTTFAVEYTYDDQDARRAEVRPAHRAFLADLHARGTLVASGPYLDGDVAGALLLVRAQDTAAVAAVLDEDPFRLEGLLAARSVRAWDPVFRSWED